MRCWLFQTDFHLQYNNATNPDPTKVDGAAEAHRQLSERIIQLANRASWFDAYTLLLRHALITGVSVCFWQHKLALANLALENIVACCFK